MKKRILIILSLFLAAAVLCVLAIAVVLPQFKNPVLYPKLDFENGAINTILMLSLPLIIAALLIILAVWLFITKRKDYTIIAIILIFTFIPGSLVCFSFDISLLSDNIWYSESEERKQLDGYVENTLEFEVLDANDLVFFYKASEITEYHYKFYPWYESEEFTITFSVQLTKERFEEAINLLKTETAFVQNGNDNNGNFTVSEAYYFYRDWKGSIIEYNSEANTISFFFHNVW